MTKPQRATPHARGQFQSTPSVWRETVFSVFYGKILPFQSTPSVWRETQRATAQCLTVLISIHSLRVEGDESIDIKTDAENDFNPLPPCGGRRPILFKLLSKIYFNPLPPCGGRRAVQGLPVASHPISIHSLRVEGDSNAYLRQYAPMSISIHSLRVEGDPDTAQRQSPRYISIHSLRVEGDGDQNGRLYLKEYFNPLPPCGGRLLHY